MSDMELGELEGEKIYNPEDVVWVKLSGMWWPAEVQDQAKLDPEVTEGLKKPPLCVVQFLLESSYLHIKSLDQIYHYNCKKKIEFMKLGFKKYHKNKNEKNVSIWPDVIREAERRTGGDPDIINDPEIAPVVDKPDVGRTGSKKRSSLPVGGQRGQGSRHSLPAGHFSGGSVNSPRRGTSVSDDGSNEASHHTRVYFIQRLAPKADNDPESELYVCDLCDIRTADLERYVIHYKLNHIRRISSGRSQPPARSLPGPSKPKKERKRKEENASPIVKKRKKKSVVVREESPHPEVREEPPNVHERSMECEQILKDWSDEDEEIKEGGKSSPPEDVAGDENSVPQPIVEPEDSLAIKNGTSGDTSESNSKTAEASVPPKSSSCFDFDDEESTQPEVQTLKFGQKLPRVISPEKSKSTATDILSEGLESFLNEVAVPELPSIPSLKHACSSPKRFREGKKPITSPARETDKKNKEESGLSTSSHQTVDDAKDATAEIQSEDKHFLVEGPLQSKKRKGFGLTEGAEDGSAGKKQKSSGDDEPSKKDDALETGDDVLKSGDDGHLEKVEILPKAGGDSKLIGSLSEPVKVEIPSDLNDSKSDCASKSKSSISELDKQSLIDTLTYSPSSVDNDFSLKRRKKKRGKDELSEKTRRNESKNSGSIVSENKKSLNKLNSPPSDDSSTTRRKNKKRMSKIPSETPKLEHQKTLDTTNLRSGSKDESSPSSRSRSCKSKGTPKTQIKEKRWEGSPDAKSKSKSPRTKKSRYSRRGDSECQGLDDDGQSIHEAPSATDHSGTSPKQMKTGKSKKSLEKKDKSDLDQAPKLDSAEKTKNESSTVSTKSKDAAGDTGSINKDIRTSSIIDEERAIDDQTIIASESDQQSVHSSRLRSSKGVLQDRSPSQKTEIEESKKEKDSKKEAKSDGNSEDTDGIRSAESDSMASDLNSQKPTENSKIGLEKNEFLEVSKLMPLKQNETPKLSVVEGSDTMRSPTGQDDRLEKQQESVKSSDFERKDQSLSVGELATPVKREKKSRDKAESSKKKDRKRDAESRNQREEETRCKESKLHSTRRSKESILSYDKSPSKTAAASVPNDNRRSRSSLSSRSGEKSGRKVESTSSSSKSRVDLKASTPKEDKGHSRNKRSSRLSDSRGETIMESSSVGVPATEDNVKDLKDSTPKEDKRHSRSKRSSRSSDSRGEITVESSSVDVPATEDIVKDSNDLTPKEGDSKSKRSSSSSDSRNKTKKLNLSSSTSGDLPTKKVAKDTKNSTPKEEKGHSRSKRSSRSSDNRGDTTVESKSFAVPATEDVVKDSKDPTPEEDKGHSRSKRSSRSSDNRGDTTVESSSIVLPATEDVKDFKDSTPEEDKGHSKSKRSSRSSDSRGETTVQSSSVAVPATEDVKDFKDSTPEEDKGHSKSKRSSRSSDSRGETTVESSSVAVPATKDIVKDSKDTTPKEEKGHSKSKRSSRSSDSRDKTEKSNLSSTRSGDPSSQNVDKDSKNSTPKDDKGHSRSKRSSRLSDSRGDTIVESSSVAVPPTEDVVKDSEDSAPKEEKGHSRNKRSSRSSDNRGDTTLKSSSVAVPATEDVVNDSKDSTPKEEKGHSRNKRSSRSSDYRGDTTVESISVAVPATKDVFKDSKDSTPKEEKGHSRSKRSSHDVIKSSKDTSKSERNLEAATSNDDELMKTKSSTRSHDTPQEGQKPSSSPGKIVPASLTMNRRSSRSHDGRVNFEESFSSHSKSSIKEPESEKSFATLTELDHKEHSRSKRSLRSRDSRDGKLPSPRENSFPATEIAKHEERSAAAAPSATDERDLPGTNLLYVSTDQSVDTVVPNSSPKKRISADLEVPMEMTNKNEIETSILSNKITKSPFEAGTVFHRDAAIVPSSTSVFEDGAKEISEPPSSPCKDIPSTSVEICEDAGPKKAKLSLSNEFCGPKTKLNDIDESPDSLSMGAPTDGPLSVATLETSTSNEAQLVGACKSLSSYEEKLVDRSFSVPTNDILAEDSGKQTASRSPPKNEATSKETIPSGKSEHRNTIQASSAEETSKVSVSSVDFDSLLPMTQVEQKTMVQLSSQSDMLSSNEAHSGTAPIHQESSQDQESSLATPLISEPPTVWDVPAVGSSTPRESEAGITVATTAETNTDSLLNYVTGADLTSRPENDSSMLEKVQSPLAVKMEEKTGGILPCTTPGKFEIEISTSEIIAETSNESLKKDQSPSAEKPKEQIDIPPCLTNSGGFKDELSTVESISEDLQLSEKVREEQSSRVEETVELMKDILPCPAISGGTAKTELSTDDVVPKLKSDEQLGKKQSPSAEATQVRMDEVLPCDTVPKIEVSTGGIIKELESNPDGEVETSFECRKMEESKINFVDSQITQPLVPSLHVSMEEDNVTVSSSLKEPIDSIASAGSPLKSGTSCKDELQNMGFKKLDSESSKIEADETEDSIRQGSETAMFEKTPSPTKSVNSCISPEKPKEEPKMLELPQAPQVTARASRWDNPFPMKKSDSRPSTPTNLLLSPTKSVSPANKVKVEIKSGLGRSCFKSPPDLKSTIIDAKQTTVGSSVKVETKQPDRTTNASDFVDELSALQAEIASYSECKVPGSLPKPNPPVETMNADSLRLKTVEVGANARDSKTDKIEKKVEAKCSAPASPMACRKPPEIILKPINVSPPKVLGLSEAALLASLLKGDDEESIQAANKVNVASPKKDIVKPLQPVAQSVQSPSKAPVFEKPDDNNRGLGKTKSNLLRPIVTNLADIPVVISSIPLPLSEPLITSSHQTPIVIPVEAPKVSTQNQVPNKLCLDDTPTSKVQVLEVERSQPQAGLVGGIDPSKLLDINDIPFVFEEDLIEEGLMPSEPSSMQSIASNLDSVSSTVETQSSYASEKTNVVSSTANEPEETFAIEDLVEEVVEEEPATDSTLSGNVVTEDEFTTDETSYEDKVYEARQVRQIFIEVTDDTDPNYDFLCSLPIAPFGKYAVEQPSTPAKKVVEAPPIQTKRVTTVTTEPKLISLSNAGKLVSGVSGLSGAPQIIRMQTIKSSADLERQKVQVASGSQPDVSKKPLQLRMVKDAKTGTTKFMVKPQLVQQSGKAACKKLVMSHQIKSLVKSPGNVVTSNAVSTKTPSLIQINKGPLATTKLVPRVTTPSILGQRRVLRHPVQTQRSSSIPIQRPPRSKLTSDFLVGSNAVRLPQDRSGLILSNNNVLPEISSANPVLLSGSNQIVLSSANQPKYVSFVVNKPPEPKKPGKDLLEQALTGLDVQSEEAPNIMPTATVVYGMLTEPLQQRPIMTTAVQPSQVILSHDQLLTFDDPSTPVGETNR